MIEPDWVDPTQDPKPEKLGRWEFLRATFTTKVGWWNRLVFPVGLALVAVQSNVWVTVICGVTWLLTAQMALLDSHSRGWLEGAQFMEDHEPNQHIDMMDFIDLCEKHGVPTQEVEKMIWRDEK